MAATTVTKKSALAFLGQNSDILTTLLLVGVIFIMILPVPPILMDLFLSFNITFSVIILIVSMYALKPLDFSIFPSLLLITTLFRLSLNVSSTRLILLNGDKGTEAAGDIISAFGNFVVGGNYVVGIVVFSILVLINFIVITKGAGRIAEVGARFTLDAMPGKQMSIDADLSAGLINDSEAKARRREIEQEADFYGAMDGASKFVRGDAIAGILITLINILGGLVIGVLQHDMEIADAVRTYTLLTVGDGLVSQIPALVISTAAGTIVTRAATNSNLGDDIRKQITFQPRAIAIAAGVVLALAAVPGLPTLPFLILATMSGVSAYFLMEKEKAEKLRKVELEKQAEVKDKPQEKVEALLKVDALEMEVGYGLISMVNEEQDGTLLEKIRSIRRQTATELGLVIPSVRIRDNLELSPNEYTISVKGVVVGRGEIMPEKFMAMNSGEATESIPGIDTKEPAFGLPAIWIDEKDKSLAMSSGYTVVDPITVVATHLSEIINNNAPELLGRQGTQNLLDTLKEFQPKLIEELIPGLISLGTLQSVLKNLLKERVSIRDLTTICETISDNAQSTKDPETLSELARGSLARQISDKLSENNKIKVFTLHPVLENEIVGCVEKNDQGGTYLAMSPEKAQLLLTEVEKMVMEISAKNIQPIMICYPQIRLHIKKLLERFIPNLIVISHSEVAKEVEIETLGVVTIANEG